MIINIVRFQFRLDDEGENLRSSVDCFKVMGGLVYLQTHKLNMILCEKRSTMVVVCWCDVGV